MKPNTQLKKTCNAVAACLAFRTEMALRPSRKYLESTWLNVLTTSLVLNIHPRSLRRMHLRGELVGKREHGSLKYRALEVMNVSRGTCHVSRITCHVPRTT